MSYSDLPPLQSLDLSQLKELATSFVAPRKNYSLPRIAFFGYFKYLSMTDCRHVCKALGFEYIEDIPFGTFNEGQMSTLTSKLREVTDYTRLVIIGVNYDDSIFQDLYRTYRPTKTKPTRLPIIIENSIPIMMESELVKIHPDYPNVNMQTCWKNLNL